MADLIIVGETSAAAAAALINNKVTKEPGKELSDNNFTNEEKELLSKLPPVQYIVGATTNALGEFTVEFIGLSSAPDHVSVTAYSSSENNLTATLYDGQITALSASGIVTTAVGLGDKFTSVAAARPVANARVTVIAWGA